MGIFPGGFQYGYRRSHCTNAPLFDGILRNNQEVGDAKNFKPPRRIGDFTDVGFFSLPGDNKFLAVVAARLNQDAALGANDLGTVVMHLDHGSSYELAMKAFRAGYTSVMIDGSHHVFEENIEITKEVVRACHAAGIPVEAELGKVGGKEDDLDGGNGNGYTVPSEAAEFVERTGVDSLAVAIGTAHGVYKGTPKLDIDRLSEIRKVVSVPLVLHGTSGVPDDAVRECVARGMCKVNYATDLRIAFSKGLKEYLAGDPEAFDPKKYSAVGREQVKEYVMSKILVCGSNGKA